ncbi:MAG: hypothetical protein LBE71_06495, partial [Dysgonamonadaceae bacterium]|nr:hypothetical protein [Dysgonamonadaceae bacterium]
MRLEKHPAPSSHCKPRLSLLKINPAGGGVSPPPLQPLTAGFRFPLCIKRDKQKANGNVPLFCRITVDGREVRFGMKKNVHPKYWDV